MEKEFINSFFHSFYLFWERLVSSFDSMRGRAGLCRRRRNHPPPPPFFFFWFLFLDSSSQVKLRIYRPYFKILGSGEGGVTYGMGRLCVSA